MANYIKNRLTILGTADQIKEVFNKYNTHYPARLNESNDGTIICRNIKSENFSCGWFNLKNGNFETRENDIVNGLPDGWELEIIQPYNHFPDFNKILPQPENIFNGDLGIEDKKRCKREGIPTWYDWNCENWGTKWNSFGCVEESNNSFFFETAWQGVPDLISKLSKQNPNMEFIYEFADEDTGHNCGLYKFLNGKSIEKFTPNGGTNEAYEISFKLRPEISKNYKLANGSYEYVGEQ